MPAEVYQALCRLFQLQVGILRRGRYMKGKQVGKGEMVKVGDQVRICFKQSMGSCELWCACKPGKGEMVKVGDQVRNACHFGCHYWLLFYQS